MWKIENYSKHFGKVTALAGVTITLEENKAYGLVGANGSGKSTLVNLLTGCLRQDTGRLFEDGKEIIIEKPKDALRYGVCAAHQDLSLVSDLPVVNNLLLGNETKRRGNFLDFSKTIERAREILQRMNVDIPLNRKVGDLTRDELQIIEIAKALVFNPILVFFDEPTSFLIEDQIKRLFEIIEELKRRATVVFVSHRLGEVFEVCDEVIVLRDGKNVARFDLKKANLNEVVRAMVGGKIIAASLRKKKKSKVLGKKKPFLSIEKLNARKIENLSLDVKKGEIVGLAGLVGHGQSDLLKALYGLISSRGSIKLEGKKLLITSPAEAIKGGIIYISGNTAEGIFPPRSVKENIAVIRNTSKPLFAHVNNKMDQNLANMMVKKLSIDCRNIEEPVRSLSGGNQQKVFVVRGLSVEPNVLLLDDPLKGIDIMTKREFSKIITEFSKRNAVLFFSTDISELLPIASRILVMYEGKIVDQFSGKRMRKDKILATAIRGKIDEIC